MPGQAVPGRSPRQAGTACPHCRATAVRDITAAQDAASGYLAPALRHPRILQGALAATWSLPEILKCRPTGAGFQGIRDHATVRGQRTNACVNGVHAIHAVPARVSFLRYPVRIVDVRSGRVWGRGVRVTPPYRAVLCSHHGSRMSTGMWSGCSCSLCIRSVCGPHMRRRSLLALRTL